MKRRSAVSLAFELGEVHDAIAGVLLIARELQGPGVSDDPEYPQTIASTFAGLAMVVARLKVVVAVTFTPTGGTARTVTKKYTLKLK